MRCNFLLLSEELCENKMTWNFTNIYVDSCRCLYIHVDVLSWVFSDVVLFNTLEKPASAAWFLHCFTFVCMWLELGKNSTATRNTHLARRKLQTLPCRSRRDPIIQDVERKTELTTVKCCIHLGNGVSVSKLAAGSSLCVLQLKL